MEHTASVPTFSLRPAVEEQMARLERISRGRRAFLDILRIIRLMLIIDPSRRAKAQGVHSSLNAILK